MGLEELAPVNTKRAKATAVTAFMRFLKAEGVTEEYVPACIERDESGKCFVSVMDKFGMHLAFNEGKKGKPLARYTSMQYYRQAKIWLFDQFPQHRASLETRLLKMGETLDSFCMKRDGGGFISKAPPCTKVDLKRLLVYLYVNASCSRYYQDAALLYLLWHLFGRASDLALLRKPDVSIDAGNVLFVRFIRMKTSEEQGLSLFAGTEFETCPMLAMALALLMQTAPSPSVIDNLPETPDQAAISLSPDVPLLEVLDHPADTTGLGVPSTTGVATTPTVYSHVNRVLDRITVAAGVDVPLTSHSFRRGCAQHANGSGESTARWIFDRGAWNICTTNKGFNYIFNTSKENHKLWRAPISRLQKSDAKQLVAFMKLFSDGGFVLDATAEDFRDKLLQLGTRAEKAVLAFLDELGISSRGSGAVLKHLRTLHRAGTLNARIERHEQLLQSAAICDPAPGYTQNVLEQITG
ncbi:hypothetical protein AM587_10003044 [Phytophthora nicotianae]|uniref:Uncharacterized protein n=1 Tax=Phytophthora nicotianae TaxID=4792 RepID=A0A0W8CTD4_PHYNI|nr:hypothetical protein AM587_10003044 [Phytophthora nicotianae]